MSLNLDVLASSSPRLFSSDAANNYYHAMTARSVLKKTKKKKGLMSKIGSKISGKKDKKNVGDDVTNGVQNTPGAVEGSGGGDRKELPREDDERSEEERDNKEEKAPASDPSRGNSIVSDRSDHEKIDRKPSAEEERDVSSTSSNSSSKSGGSLKEKIISKMKSSDNYSPLNDDEDMQDVGLDKGGKKVPEKQPTPPAKTEKSSGYGEGSQSSDCSLNSYTDFINDSNKVALSLANEMDAATSAKKSIVSNHAHQQGDSKINVSETDKSITSKSSKSSNIFKRKKSKSSKTSDDTISKDENAAAAIKSTKATADYGSSKKNSCGQQDAGPEGSCIATRKLPAKSDDNLAKSKSGGVEHDNRSTLSKSSKVSKTSKTSKSSKADGIAVPPVNEIDSVSSVKKSIASATAHAHKQGDSKSNINESDKSSTSKTSKSSNIFKRKNNKSSKISDDNAAAAIKSAKAAAAIGSPKTKSQGQEEAGADVNCSATSKLPAKVDANLAKSKSGGIEHDNRSTLSKSSKVSKTSKTSKSSKADGIAAAAAVLAKSSSNDSQCSKTSEASRRSKTESITSLKEELMSLARSKSSGSEGSIHDWNESKISKASKHSKTSKAASIAVKEETIVSGGGGCIVDESDNVGKASRANSVATSKASQANSVAGSKLSRANSATGSKSSIKSLSRSPTADKREDGGDQKVETSSRGSLASNIKESDSKIISEAVLEELKFKTADDLLGYDDKSQASKKSSQSKITVNSVADNKSRSSKASGNSKSKKSKGGSTKASSFISEKGFEDILAQALACSKTPEDVAKYLLENDAASQFLKKTAAESSNKITDNDCDVAEKGRDVSPTTNPPLSSFVPPVSSFEQPELLSAASSVTHHSYPNNSKMPLKTLSDVHSAHTEILPRDNVSGQIESSPIKNRLSSASVRSLVTEIVRTLSEDMSRNEGAIEEQGCQDGVGNIAFNIDCDSSGDGSAEINLLNSHDNVNKSDNEDNDKKVANKVNDEDEGLHRELGEISRKLSLVSSIVTEMVKRDDGSDASTAESSSESTMPTDDDEQSVGKVGTPKRSNSLPKSTNVAGRSVGGVSGSRAKSVADTCANDCGEAAEMMGKAATCDPEMIQCVEDAFMDGTGLPGDSNDEMCKTSSGLVTCGFDFKEAVSGVRDMFSMPASIDAPDNTVVEKEGMDGACCTKGILRVSSFQPLKQNEGDSELLAPTPMQRISSTISWKDLKEKEDVKN